MRVVLLCIVSHQVPPCAVTVFAAAHGRPARYCTGGRGRMPSCAPWNRGNSSSADFVSVVLTPCRGFSRMVTHGAALYHEKPA